jgi:hypothetical protein
MPGSPSASRTGPAIENDLLFRIDLGEPIEKFADWNSELPHLR